MHNAWSAANYKIGISNSPGRRQAEVCFSYEVDPQIIAKAWFTTTKAAQKAELSWHRFLEDWRTDDHPGKEWFSLGEEYVRLFCQWAGQAMSASDIRGWLYKVGATRTQQDDYNYHLIREIPRRKHPPSIDLWMNNDFRGSSS
jgi:hypothetical protein